MKIKYKIFETEAKNSIDGKQHFRILKRKRGWKMKTVTIEQFLEFDPCYTEEKIREIAGDKKEWTALDVLKLNLPITDRLWAVLREEFIPAKILHTFACDCADRALSKTENPDERSINAVKVKRLWIEGKATDEELSAAWSEACSAAYEAAGFAAYEEAGFAACEAAWFVAYEAAQYVAQYDARGSERNWQVIHLVEMLEGEHE